MKNFTIIKRALYWAQYSVKGWGAALPLLFALLAWQPATAQCDLACNGGNPNFPLSIPVNGACMVMLTSEDVLEEPGLCPGDKVLTIRDTMNNIIVSDTNYVAFDPQPYEGQVLSVNVTHVATGVFCNSFIQTVDNRPPIINCSTDTLSCIMDISVAAIGLPDVSDNCTNSADISLQHTDFYTSYDCDEPYAARLERTWTATDESGNSSSCVQLIYLARPDLAEVVFPADTVLRCDSVNLSLSSTGQPQLFGEIIGNSSACGLSVIYNDDTLTLCGSIEYQVQRSWTVMDACSGDMATDVQFITVVDTVAPLIQCPDPITVPTNTSACHATVTLPTPDVVDNCDPEASFYVSTTFGAVGVGPHGFVPTGTHTLQYTAVDLCGNTRTCTTTLTVVDEEIPTAVCNSVAIVSITNGGLGRAFATTFNEGSNDNCTQQLYYKARRMATGGCGGANGDDSSLPGYQEWFDDEVFFCCEELDEDIQVVLRVYEINPGAGPVDPTREIPGGDLFGTYAECMVNVQVQDKLAPDVGCPQNFVINCTDDYSDLSIFGDAVALDNCSAELSLEESVQIGECSTGIITRTFTAVDPSGNVGGCVQTIEVVNPNPFSEDNITWPANYTTTVCGAAVEPNQLPAGFGQPVLNGVTCASIGTNYSEEFFDVAFPACYKIIRDWTIIDWCQYDPEVPNSPGRFTSRQVIKVEDHSAPVMSCPSDRTVAIGADCDSAYVNLPLVSADDCSTNIFISNNSPHADAAGANGSGNYPIGTTTFKYYASDRCGNVASCTVRVTVEDQTPPQPVCIVGLSINLAMQNGEPVASIDAAAFDGNTRDNCTVPQDLKLFIRVAGSGPSDLRPSTTQLSFSCEDVGAQMIEFWAEDEAGNSDRCLTVLSVQDNGNLCPQTASGLIAGEISTEGGQYVEGVMVEVMNDPMLAYTANNGFFELLGLTYGNSYTLRPERDGDYLNGVSTLDLILISRHILGVMPLNTPYKMIAADVNRSNTISTLDLIALRKMILGMETEFPNGNTSWRFVDANHLFLNPNNPFATPFPEVVNINEFNQDHTDANFVAIKIGDVDLSASPNDFDDIDDRNAQGSLTLNVPDVSVKEGQTFTLPFTASGMDEVLGYQFTLRFSTEYLEYEDMSMGSLPSLDEGNFNVLKTRDGWLTTSWNVMDRKPSAELIELFAITFRARRDIASLEELLEITGVPTAHEAYGPNGEPMAVALNLGQAITSTGAVRVAGYELYQNQPNPFSDRTLIGFKLPMAGEARITVFDMSGKLLFTQEQYYDAGAHEIVIKSSDLAASGLLYYQLRTANYAATRKMILMQ